MTEQPGIAQYVMVGFDEEVKASCSRTRPLILDTRTKELFFGEGDSDSELYERLPWSLIKEAYSNHEITLFLKEGAAFSSVSDLMFIPTSVDAVAVFATKSLKALLQMEESGSLSPRGMDIKWSTMKGRIHEFDVTCVSEKSSETILNHWGNTAKQRAVECMREFYIRDSTENVNRAEEIVAAGLCAAIKQEFRDTLYLLLGLTKVNGQAPEHLGNVFLIASLESPHWGWTTFVEQIEQMGVALKLKGLIEGQGGSKPTELQAVRKQNAGERFARNIQLIARAPAEIQMRECGKVASKYQAPTERAENAILASVKERPAETTIDISGQDLELLETQPAAYYPGIIETGKRPRLNLFKLALAANEFRKLKADPGSIVEEMLKQIGSVVEGA